MINKINSQTNIDAMLATLRQHQVDSTGNNTPPVLTPPTPEVGKPTFGEAIKSASSTPITSARIQVLWKMPMTVVKMFR
jgi:hypothetical protein